MNLHIFLTVRMAIDFYGDRDRGYDNRDRGGYNSRGYNRGYDNRDRGYENRDRGYDRGGRRDYDGPGGIRLFPLNCQILNANGRPVSGNVVYDQVHVFLNTISITRQ